MSNFLKNYGSTLLLLGGIVAGGLCGLLSAEAGHVLKPVGDLFLNLIFVLVVPLVFFSIASSVYGMTESRMLGKTLLGIVAVFVGMSVVAGIVSYLACLAYNPLGDVDRASLLQNLPPQQSDRSESFGNLAVRALTVSDFGLLLSKSALLPLIVIAALTGYATSKTGEKGKTAASFVDSALAVTLKMMGMIMRFAPVGLGCYFASTAASLGGGFVTGYARSLVLYVAILATIYFILHSIYILTARGWNGLALYWKNMIAPSVTAVATCSSAATMPVLIDSAKRMGVSQTIAESVIPLGINLHKDGSVVSSTIKAVFLMSLFSRSIATPSAALGIMAIAILSAAVIGAVPSGGMAGEIFICSMMGFSPEMVGVIVVMGTLFDMPATLLNISANGVGAVLVDRLVSRRASDQAAGTSTSARLRSS